MNRRKEDVAAVDSSKFGLSDKIELMTYIEQAEKLAYAQNDSLLGPLYVFQELRAHFNKAYDEERDGIVNENAVAVQKACPTPGTSGIVLNSGSMVLNLTYTASSQVVDAKKLLTALEMNMGKKLTRELIDKLKEDATCPRDGQRRFKVEIA